MYEHMCIYVCVCIGIHHALAQIHKCVNIHMYVQTYTQINWGKCFYKDWPKSSH